MRTRIVLGVALCMPIGLYAQTQIILLECKRINPPGKHFTFNHKEFTHLRFDGLNGGLSIYTLKSGNGAGNFRGGGSWEIFRRGEDDYFEYDVDVGKLKIFASARTTWNKPGIDLWRYADYMNINRVSGEITITKMLNSAQKLLKSAEENESGICEVTTSDPAAISPPPPPRTKF